MAALPLIVFDVNETLDLETMEPALSLRLSATTSTTLPINSSHCTADASNSPVVRTDHLALRVRKAGISSTLSMELRTAERRP